MNILNKQVWVKVTVCVYENRHCRLVRVDDSACAREDGTALLVQVESSTVVSMKMNTAWQVQVAGSTVFGCGMCPFPLGFGFFGTQIGLGLVLGLVGVLSIWTIGLGCENQLGPSPITFHFLLSFFSFSHP